MKINRDLANLDIVNSILFKKTSYRTLARKNELLEELLKTTEEHCPFSGVLYDIFYSFNVEHFYPKSIYLEKQCEWENLMPCASIHNKNFGKDKNLLYPNVYSPNEVDYVEKLKYNAITGKIEPRTSNDQVALNTIKRYYLNDKNVINARKTAFNYYKKYQEKQNFYEYFQEYLSNN